jgi:outer membrane protein assembly factor BamB
LVVSGEGATVWRRELAERTTYVPAGAVSGPPVLGDFLGGGGLQLAIGLWAGALVVIDPADGEILARHRFGIDTDGRRRLGRNRRLPRFLRAILTEAGEPINELLSIELDGVSGSEVVFGCSDGLIYAYSPRSDRVLWSHDSLGQVFRGPAPVDANGDGVCDVLAWDEEGVYLIDGSTGSQLEGFPPGESLSNAALADLDRDGTVELVEIRRDGSIHAFATGLKCARAPGAAGCGE